MSAAERSIRVVVVDDQPVVRTGLAAILDAQDDIQVVGEAADGQAALDTAARLDPDVVLLDIRMPGMDGLTAARELAARSDRPRVLVMTTFDLDEYVHDALRAGAAGFLLKDATRQELVQAVRVVAAGDGLLAPGITRRLIEAFAAERSDDARASSAGGSMRAPGLGSLTDREREVLVLIGGGLTNGEIADRLILGESTVKTHVNRIFTKLAVRDRVQAVIVAYDAGLVAPGGLV